MPLSIPVLREKEHEEAVDIILEASPFYSKHGKTVARTRDALVIILYVIVFFIVILTTWIKLQTGQFPFNVEPFAKASYSQNGWPWTVFIIVLFGFLALVVVRLVIIGLVENSIGTIVENKLKKDGSLRKFEVKNA